MRKLSTVLAAAAVLVCSGPALAHEEMVVAGKVTAVSAKSLQVRTSDGKTITLEMDSNTRAIMGGKRVNLPDVRVGHSVKVLGFGDSVTKLVALDVTVDPQTGKR